MAGGSDSALRAFRLPAFRSLGELADRAPVIVIDTREQDPLTFERLTSVRGTLQTGKGTRQIRVILYAKEPSFRAWCRVKGKLKFAQQIEAKEHSQES